MGIYKYIEIDVYNVVCGKMNVDRIIVYDNSQKRSLHTHGIGNGYEKIEAVHKLLFEAQLCIYASLN